MKYIKRLFYCDRNLAALLLLVYLGYTPTLHKCLTLFVSI